MANELKVAGYTAGRTVVAHILDDGMIQIGADIATVELSSGNYAGSVPTLAAGDYTVTFTDGAVVIASGVLYWDGTREVGIESAAPIDWTQIKAKIDTGFKAIHTG